MFAVYKLVGGEHVMAVRPISKAELAALPALRCTFFGEVRQPGGHCRTLVDWWAFFYETYKDTFHKKTLKRITAVRDIEHLRILSQPNLAIELAGPAA